ncbi:Rieske (2Fe-2S) protein [Nocardioides sp. SR21]|uniref:Rieske (2Fe-2S) protein n=1 Tax=Nocardioides sp. SR21 TaxID=2919501 RepID=UPI001FAA76E1|nr:Rieske (2Fe-2S) protein [Nocardioides sp. SR21]
MSREGITRRNALSGAATAGVALPLLAACGGSEETTAKDPGSATTPGEVLASTSDIPVGGGEIFADQSVVVTQPTEGDFKCFSAVCTHQGCLVSNVKDGAINCTCHGSSFSIEDGSVLGGPAPSALSSVDVSVEGDDISIA